MERKDMIRLNLARAYEECLQRKPESKITVRDITDACGMPRQMFYRFFSDKKSLIYWYHAFLVQDALIADDDFRWGNSIQALMRMMQSHRRFYTKASRDCNDAVLLEILIREIGLMYRNVIEFETGRPMSDETAISLRIYCNGGVRYLYHWMQTGMKRPISQMTELFYAAMPQELRNLLTVHPVPMAYLRQHGGDMSRMGATDDRFHG